MSGKRMPSKTLPDILPEFPMEKTNESSNADGNKREAAANGLVDEKYVSIAPDVKLGKNIKFSKFVNLYGCEVGDDTKIGAFVEIQKNAKVGRRCKISSHTFICEGVTIEDEVFIGHNVTFVNDSFPRATNGTGALQNECDWKVERTVVKKGASIGSGVTVLANVVIGEKALVGAGSVVTKDVPAYAIIAGNPGKVLRYLASGDEDERTQNSIS
jgi:acetyltransferase-like isoleucine patch superfamily enzyme